MRLPTRHVLSLLTAAVAAAAGCGRTPSDPRGAGVAEPRAGDRRDPVAGNARCEACHAEIAAEWRDSLHRSAHSDPVYQRAFAREPLPFCTACHAPEANAEDPGPSLRHAIGIACVTCHPLTAEHPSTRASTKSESCARCHEFTFPGTGEAMQLTVREHHASSRAALGCTSCHMPEVAATGSARRHVSHRFAASRDAAMVRSAAHIEVDRSGSMLRFSFTPDRAGHAFPTGDLFRRLRLVAELRGPGPPRRVESFLGRKTRRADPLGGAPVNAADDRPFLDGKPSLVELDIGDASRPVEWRVLYERVEHPVSLDEADAIVEGAIEVASGAL